MDPGWWRATRVRTSISFRSRTASRSATPGWASSSPAISDAPSLPGPPCGAVDRSQRAVREAPHAERQRQRGGEQRAQPGGEVVDQAEARERLIEHLKADAQQPADQDTPSERG